MEVRATRDEATYRAALAEVSVLIDVDPAPKSAEVSALE